MRRTAEHFYLPCCAAASSPPPPGTLGTGKVSRLTRALGRNNEASEPIVHSGTELKMIAAEGALRERGTTGCSHANEVEGWTLLLKDQRIAHIPPERPMTRGIVFHHAAQIERRLGEPAKTQ